MAITTQDFVGFPGQTSIGEAVPQLEELTEEKRFIVIERSDGDFVLASKAWLKDQLRATADRIGPAILDLELEQIPGLPEPCRPANADATEDERIERLRSSPGGITVILADGEPAGLLRTSKRSSIMGGVPAGLFGRRYALFEGDVVNRSLDPRVCPQCERSFDFYDPLIEGEELHYHCPHCGHRFEEL